MTLPLFWNQGWTLALVNHIWQSTAIALLAWLLSIALRNSPARVRYAIWLFASIKFLVPFSLLTGLGRHWAKPGAHNQSTQVLYFMVEEFSRPLQHVQASVAPAAPASTTAHHLPIVIATVFAAWLLGCIVLLVRWISGWRRASCIAHRAQILIEGREFDAIRRAERNARVHKPIPLLLTSCETEPGVFGVMRPVLLWPRGLSNRLDDAQIEAVMAHEIEHVRRRDNLTAAIHALVEAIFWFHPLVRWMSTRINEERELACDERVIEQNARPEAYAESILKVCAFCMEPPTPCVSGVSGADLKQRILRIMTRPPGVPLSSATRFALFASALLVVVAPLGFGMIRGQGPASSSAPSQSSTSVTLPKYEVASIKPATTDENRRMIMMTPDGMSLQGVPVQMLLQQAFGVERDRIVGAPKWVQSNRYDLQAKVAPEDAPKMEKLKIEQRREMLLPLLEERLNLKYHHETRELPMYALVVAKGGPKLAESKPGEFEPGPDGRTASPGGPLPPPGNPPPGGPDSPGAPGKRPIIGEGMRFTPGSIQSRGGSIQFLAHALSATLGRTVVDKTGLTGNYDFSLNWTPDEGMRNVLGAAPGGPSRDDAPSDANGPTLFTALEEQLGLKLESQKGTVDVIVIDHIDPPSEN